VKLPGRFQVSPQIAGAIKAIPRIVAVEHVYQSAVIRGLDPRIQA
jgi:hypothetical protein